MKKISTIILVVVFIVIFSISYPWQNSYTAYKCSIRKVNNGIDDIEMGFMIRLKAYRNLIGASYIFNPVDKSFMRRGFPIDVSYNLSTSSRFEFHYDKNLRMGFLSILNGVENRESGNTNKSVHNVGWISNDCWRDFKQYMKKEYSNNNFKEL